MTEKLKKKSKFHQTYIVWQFDLISLVLLREIKYKSYVKIYGIFWNPLKKL